MHITPRPAKNKKTVLLLLALYLLVFTWITVLTQGLPIGDFDDWDNMLLAQDLSWEQLGTNFVLPWTKSIHWDGQSGRYNAAANRRTFRTIVIKWVESFSGLNSWPQYIASKAVFFSASCVLLFMTLCGGVSRLPVSAALLFFYIFIPAHYPHLFWISDPVTMVHAFVLGGFACFLGLERRLRENREGAGSFGLLAGLFIFGWFGIKTKEPALILPLCVLIYVLLNLHEWKRNKPLFAALLFILGVLFFQIVPVEHLGTSTQEGTFRFEWDTVRRLLFRNYQCGYEDEKSFSLFSLEMTWPVSIARTFNFFFLWFILASAALYLLRRRADSSAAFLSNTMVRLSLIWLAFEFLFMGRFQPDPRYFSGTMIPLTVLTARLIECTLVRLSKGRRFYLGVGAALLCVTVLVNIKHILYLRELVGQRAGRFYKTAETIYKDAYPESNPSKRDIALFYSSTYVPDPEHPRIGNHTYFIPMGYDSWSQTGTPDPETFRTSGAEGRRYMVLYEGQKLAPHPNIKLVKEISGINEESLIEKFLYRLKNKRPEALYIYKWDDEAAPA